MNRQSILLDIDTQRDFFLPGGSLFRPSAETARTNIYRLFDWVRHEGLGVLSTVLRNRPHGIGPLGPIPHCIEGTPGEKKLTRTLLRSRVDLGMRNSTDVPLNLLGHYRQVIVEKRHTDIFTHLRAERLITEMPFDHFILCGAGAAAGIAQAALGLRARQRDVTVVIDAVCSLNLPDTQMAWRRMEAKGVHFVRTSKLTPRHLPRRQWACRSA